MKYDVAWAIKAAQQPKAKFLFFWSHKGNPNRPGPEVFSQWYPAGFTIEGVDYPTAEHWMMAQKARLFGDTAVTEQILAADNPGKAKALGRMVAGFDAQVWASAAYDIVVQGSVAKFSAHAALRSYILETGNKILVEASPSDHIWGIGLAKSDPEAAVPAEWMGSNWLGFALMEARDMIRAGDA